MGVLLDRDAFDRTRKAVKLSEGGANIPARTGGPQFPMGAEWMEGVLDDDLDACGRATLSRWWVADSDIDAGKGDDHTLVDSGDNFTVRDEWGIYGKAGDWCFAVRINGRWQPEPHPGCSQTGSPGDSGSGGGSGGVGFPSGSGPDFDITDTITVIDSVCCDDCGADASGRGSGVGNCGCGAVGITICKSIIQFPHNVKRTRLPCEDAADDNCTDRPGGGGVGSGDNPENIVGCCANALSDTLVASFINQSGCAAIDGGTVTLTRIGSAWETAGYSSNDFVTLSGVSCTSAFRLRLECPEGSTVCTQMSLTSEDDTAQCMTGEEFKTASAGCECDSLLLSFGNYTAVAGPCDCCEDDFGEYTIVITEAA